MISLPFKILLFVLVDGWHLTIQSLVAVLPEALTTMHADTVNSLGNAGA